MTQQTQQDAKQIEEKLANSQEVWENMLSGRTHVSSLNYRGKPVDITVKGKGSKLRISTLDRELAEENIRLPEHNPFRNGTLVMISGTRLEDDERRESLDDARLLEFFTVTDEDNFNELLEDMGEVNMRRLQTLAKDKDSGVSLVQSNKIDEVIAERYAIGGDTPTYREMMRDPSST